MNQKEADGRRESMEFSSEDIMAIFPTPRHLALYLDATLLRPEATEREYISFLRECADFGFRCVVVPMYYLPLARQELKGSGVALGTVIGFPLGHSSTDAKRSEAVLALQNGAAELDMVINISALRSGREARVKEDIAAVVHLARRYDAGKGEGHVVVKVILETGYLNREEMRKGAILAKEAGADFVKTCTGFGPRGADPEEVSYLRKVVGPGFGVKASGGIRQLSDVIRMIQSGANRIGTSSAGNIMREYLKHHQWR